ncbi:hypothetical protein BGZ99_008255 [Dissophora globulifera]|uniref:Solute carrier family 40 member n=1 Tax=Dissophora globulifera TaxID=979702 RepID=A0A9P6UZ37_9FUNG|nr:hypothetical protein BGZ99_008255 [Dissophora globulifera]
MMSVSGTMIGYLQWRGFTAGSIALLKGVCTVSELLGTVMMPAMSRYVGLIRTGAWSIWLEVATLTPVLLSIYSDRLPVQVVIFVGMALSRVGVWSFDLVITQIMQEYTHSTSQGDAGSFDNAGVINGWHYSMMNVFELAQFILTMIWSNPQSYFIPCTLSFGCIVLGAIVYSTYLIKMRGHLFHYQRIASAASAASSCLVTDNAEYDDEIGEQERDALALQPNTNGNVNMALVLQGGPDGTKEGTENALALQGAKDACLWNLPSNQGFQYRTCTLHTLTPSSETPGAYSGLIPAKANENDFMMALGYFPSKAIQTAANANGNKLFAIADFEFTPPVGNIVSVMYSEDQIGYIAGLLAGEVAKSRGGKVAVIGGVDQPSVRRQVNGFGSGVRIACLTCKAYGLYAGKFDADPRLTSTVAQILRDHHVSVVFNAASIFGTMTLKNLTTQDGIYGIGSGSDEWITNWAYGSVPGSEHILTSIQTDYTVMVRSVMQSVLRANLTGGSTVFYGANPNAEQSAIKLAPVHEAGAVYTKEIEGKMHGYIADMVKGKLQTGVDHKSGDSRSSGSSMLG